ncbi:Sec-independent protein translocase protein TatB [Candidatus Poriferisocius sp.]|uniref:Sec-independent protein translocase protein TatB n=1 Tax=Candidatus Poriferisocius sp. TaxID=3101276 RepID=UPI003B51F76A
MGNLGWAEVAVIVVVALVVLGPDKLPGAARQIGNVIRQFRRISTGFQQELQNALDEPIEAEARRRGELAVEQSKSANKPAPDPPPSSQ